MHLRTIFQPLPSMKFDSFQGGECLGLNKRFYRTLVSKYKTMVVIYWWWRLIFTFTSFIQRNTLNIANVSVFLSHDHYSSLVIPLKSKSRIVRFEYIAFQTWNNVENDFVRDPLC